jgi:hypothetical protein
VVRTWLWRTLGKKLLSHLPISRWRAPQFITPSWCPRRLFGAPSAHRTPAEDLTRRRALNAALMDVLVEKTADAIGAAVDAIEPILASVPGRVAAAHEQLQPHITSALAAVEPHVAAAVATVQPHVASAMAVVEPHIAAAVAAMEPHLNKAAVAAQPAVLALQPAFASLQQTAAYNRSVEVLSPAIHRVEDALGPTGLSRVALLLLLLCLFKLLRRCCCGGGLSRQEAARRRQQQNAAARKGGGAKPPSQPPKKKEKKKRVRMCQFCDIAIPTEAFMATHLVGKRHRKLAGDRPAEACWVWVEVEKEAAETAEEARARLQAEEVEHEALVAAARAAAAQDAGEWEEAGAARKKKAAAKLAAAKKKRQAEAEASKSATTAAAPQLRRHPRCADCGARARDGATIETDPDDESRGYCLACWDAFLNAPEEAAAAESSEPAPKLLPKAAGIEVARRAIYQSH